MQIKVLFSDVDGTLTDGRLYYSQDGETMKVFHVHDGYGIKHWVSLGNAFGVISARDSKPLRSRLKELGIDTFALKIDNKLAWMENWLAENNYEWKNLAYIGDDITDLPLLKKCGFSAAPNDAVNEVRESVHYLCHQRGGNGAVRELIERLLILQ